MTIEDLAPWIQLGSFLVGMLYAVVRMEKAIQRVEDTAKHHSEILMEIKAVLASHQTLLDEHDRLVGRGVPPPETTLELKHIREALRALDKKC
jgi:hypothetical protein